MPSVWHKQRNYTKCCQSDTKEYGVVKMSTRIIRANEHYENKTDWLTTYHHFSFADYQNPDKMNFGPLRVFNDDEIQPGTGFDFHHHRDMEIITYVIDGELEHKDNQGNQGVIYPGEVQRMTAGSGIMHAESNHSKEKPLRLLQMWVFANKKKLAPSWEQKKFTKKDRTNKLVPVVVSENSSDPNALHIHQDAAFYLATLTPKVKWNTSWDLEENHTCL